MEEDPNLGPGRQQRFQVYDRLHCTSYNLGQKVLRILLFLTHRRPTLRIWHHGDPSPPPLPGQCCSVGSKNVRATLQHCFFGGEGGVS